MGDFGSALPVCVGVVFVASGAAKWPRYVVPYLRELGIPPIFAGIASPALAIVEVALGLFLITNVAVRPAAAAAAILSLTFGLTVGFAAERTANVSCGCFGRLDDLQPKQVTVARSLALAAAAIYLWLQAPASSPALSWTPVALFETLVSAAGFVMLFALIGHGIAALTLDQGSTVNGYSLSIGVDTTAFVSAGGEEDT